MSLLHSFIVYLLPFISIALASGPTSIFINKVPEYALLSTCAEVEVSTIVRDMENGCGDDQHTTSYACFCYESSAKFSSMIGAHVMTACASVDPKQNMSAVDVFSKYCQLADLEAAPTTSSDTTSRASATPASGPATVTVTPSSTSSADSEDNSDHDTPVVAIAVGVSVPVVVIAAGILGVVLWRRRRRHGSAQNPAELSGEEQVVEPLPAPDVHELKQEPNVPPVEIGDGAQPPELDTPTKDVYASRLVHELDNTGNREKS